MSDTDTEILWGDPPDKEDARTTRLTTLVAQLTANPGKWGRDPREFSEQSVRTTVTDRRKRYSTCRWRYGKLDDGKWYVWGMFPAVEAAAELEAAPSE